MRGLPAHAGTRGSELVSSHSNADDSSSDTDPPRGCEWAPGLPGVPWRVRECPHRDPRSARAHHSPWRHKGRKAWLWCQERCRSESEPRRRAAETSSLARSLKRSSEVASAVIQKSLDIGDASNASKS